MFNVKEEEKMSLADLVQFIFVLVSLERVECKCLYFIDSALFLVTFNIVSGDTV